MRKVLRQEKKYIVSNYEYYKSSFIFNQVMIPDKHNGLNGYMIRSLYFDTIDDKDFHEKKDGVLRRRKIRLRLYDPKGDFAFLEMKSKEGQYQEKRSLKINKKDALELIGGNYEVLLNYEEPFAKECYTTMRIEHYIPKTVVEYNRKAFIAKENNIRLTFDSNIRANEANFNIFDENMFLYPVFPKDKIVFEVKYNGFLLSFIKDLMDNVNKSQLSVSKYCLARMVGQDYVF